MKINETDIDIDKAMDFANYKSLLFKRRNNGMYLNDFQIDVLKRNGLNYMEYTNMQTLLFDIEEVLNSDYDDELDIVGSQLAEFIYYHDTKK